MHNLMTLWQQRTRRERHLLLGMGVMLIIGFGLLRFMAATAKSRDAVAANADPGAGQSAVDAPADSPSAAASPAEIACRAARANNGDYARSRPPRDRHRSPAAAGARLGLSVQPADFQALMAWLDALGQAGMTTVTLTVAAVAQQPGRVTVTTLVLERSDEK